MKPQALSATTLTGTSVQNLEGENIGKIQDLMIELETGHVLYAVLSFGGFLGMGDDYFAIPMEALIFPEDDQKVIKLDVDKERLKNAPGFDKNNWPSHSSGDTFVRSVYDYYGYKRKKTPTPGI